MELTQFNQFKIGQKVLVTCAGEYKDLIGTIRYITAYDKTSTPLIYVEFFDETIGYNGQADFYPSELELRNSQ